MGAEPTNEQVTTVGSSKKVEFKEIK